MVFCDGRSSSESEPVFEGFSPLRCIFPGDYLSSRTRKSVGWDWIGGGAVLVAGVSFFGSLGLLPFGCSSFVFLGFVFSFAPRPYLCPFVLSFRTARLVRIFIFDITPPPPARRTYFTTRGLEGPVHPRQMRGIVNIYMQAPSLVRVECARPRSACLICTTHIIWRGEGGLSFAG